MEPLGCAGSPRPSPRGRRGRRSVRRRQVAVEPLDDPLRRSIRRSGRPLRDRLWLSSGKRTNSAVLPRRRSDTNHCSACSCGQRRSCSPCRIRIGVVHVLDVRQRRALPVPLQLIARGAVQLALAEPRPDVAGAVERDEVREAAHRNGRLEAVGVPDDPVGHDSRRSCRRPRPGGSRPHRRAARSRSIAAIRSW